jgi:hypothetical protein
VPLRPNSVGDMSNLPEPTEKWLIIDLWLLANKQSKEGSDELFHLRDFWAL